MRGWVRSSLVPALLGLVVTASGVAAQGIRGTALSTSRYVQLRPIQQDTIARDQATLQADGTYTFDGLPVTCIDDQHCVFFHSTDVEHAVAFTQDVGFTAWGFGMQGLSATVALRARADLGGGFPWPRSEDNFDALLAYLELNRNLFRFRLGRQRTTSGLGFSGFDGASVMAAPGMFTFEAYAGRSLARGLSEPRSEALRGIEDFVVDRQVYLLGAAAGIEPIPGTSLGARYQREIYANRSALLSERASVDARSDLLRPVRLDGAFDYDFAFGQVGKAHLTLALPLGRRRPVMFELTGRRYLPYFELGTIWGYFSPVGYREAEGRVSWVYNPSLSLWGMGAWRRYSDTDAPIILVPLKQEAVRAGVGTTFRPAPTWLVDASYTLERGFGATLSTGDVNFRWQPVERVALSAAGTAFQQIEEFRVGQGAVVGGGLGMDLDLNRTTGLSGGMNLYRQTATDRPGIADWNQWRGWLSLRVGFGEDPGRAGRGRR